MRLQKHVYLRFVYSLDELYAIHRLPRGIFSGSEIYSRFVLMDASPEDMLTTTLDCFLRSKGKKFVVIVKGPSTLIFRISSYLLTGLHTIHTTLQTVGGSFTHTGRHEHVRHLHIQTAGVDAFINTRIVEEQIYAIMMLCHLCCSRLQAVCNVMILRVPSSR